MKGAQGRPMALPAEKAQEGALNGERGTEPVRFRSEPL